jgi:glucose-6-phosphate 1-dehydrogenase
MAKIIPVETFDCVVFGATGDLTLRKLLPALYYRFRDGQMTEDSRIIGAARSELDDHAYRDRASAALKSHVEAKDFVPDVVRRFLNTGTLSTRSSIRSEFACSIWPRRQTYMGRFATILVTPAW